MSIKVRATTRGYYGGRIYEAGDVFEVQAKNHIGSWMDPQVEEVKAPKAEAKGGKGKGKSTESSAEQNGDAQAEANDLA